MRDLARTDVFDDVEAANERPEPTVCKVTGATCWRILQWKGMSACEQRCARADYLNGIKHEVSECHHYHSRS